MYFELNIVLPFTKGVGIVGFKGLDLGLIFNVAPKEPARYMEFIK
jgi:hypothetical protein